MRVPVGPDGRDTLNGMTACLAAMPVAKRDAVIAEVWAFLTDRGYRIVAPGSDPMTADAWDPDDCDPDTVPVTDQMRAAGRLADTGIGQ